MKKLLIALIILCLFITVTGTCYAAGPPWYLSCEPYLAAEVQPTYFLLKFDGSLIPIQTTEIYVLPDGSRALFYNLSGLPNGRHTVIAQAGNEVEVSADSPSFPFPLPYLGPGSPTLKIVDQIPPGAVPLGVSKRSR